MTLAVETAGEGPSLVLLHGWGLHSGVWTPLLARLTERFRVHRIDLPGHGRSPSVNPYTLEAVADAVAAAYDSVQRRDENPLVVGWSFGGLVAMRWVLSEQARRGTAVTTRASARVGKLMLVCASPCFVQRPDWSCAMSELTLRRFGDELTASYRATLQRFLTLQVQGSADAHAVLAQLRRVLFSHEVRTEGRGDPSPDALRHGLELLTATDLRRDVGRISVPTLVISGARDALVPAPAGVWLAAALGAGHHQLFPEAAHAPFLSHPDAFIAALNAFAVNERAATVESD